jgi:hypothetical protein
MRADKLLHASREIAGRPTTSLRIISDPKYLLVIVAAALMLAAQIDLIKRPAGLPTAALESSAALHAYV